MRTINTMYYQSKVLNYTFIRWTSYLMIERIFILINKDHRKFLSNNTFIKIKYVISNLSEKYKIPKKKKRRNHLFIIIVSIRFIFNEKNTYYNLINREYVYACFN